MSACAISQDSYLGPFVYRQRRPEKTPLYKTIQRNIETWIAKKEDVPYPIRKEFYNYLKCGIFSHGFARAHCNKCKENFLVAFSCKGRGVCPSCNTKRMAETAANLVDNVLPQVPVRQWVLTVPKRIRPFLLNNHNIARDVMKIFVDAVEKRLKKCLPNAPKNARFGGVTFFQKFGAGLNAHPHFHSCIIDGLFSVDDDRVNFHEVTDLSVETISSVLENVRKRVLRFFARRGYLDKGDVDDMLQWENGGFSLNASVRIHAYDREGLERLIRYCARPVFASERLSFAGNGKLLYLLSKPSIKGETFLHLDPLELIDKLAALIPSRRKHQRFYHGVLASHSKWRKKIIALAGKTIDTTITPVICKEEEKPPCNSKWAILIARIYEVFPLICTRCGGEMRIIAFITDTITIKRLLSHIGEPTEPPPISPARDPPEWAFQMDQSLDAPECESIDEPFYAEECIQYN